MRRQVYLLMLFLFGRGFFFGFDVFGNLFGGFGGKLFRRLLFFGLFGYRVGLVNSLSVKLDKAFTRKLGSRFENKGILGCVDFDYYSANTAYGLYLVAGLDRLDEVFCFLLLLFTASA